MFLFNDVIMYSNIIGFDITQWNETPNIFQCLSIFHNLDTFDLNFVLGLFSTIVFVSDFFSDLIDIRPCYNELRQDCQRLGALQMEQRILICAYNSIGLDGEFSIEHAYMDQVTKVRLFCYQMIAKSGNKTATPS